MSPEEKELVQLVLQWKDEIKQLVDSTAKQITALEEARKDYQKKTWFEANKDWIMPIILPVVILAVAVVAFKVSGATEIRIGDVVVSREK